MAYAPVLTDGQIDRIRVFAKPRSVVADEILYKPDDDTPPVYLVLTGRIRIVAIIGGEEQLVTTYGPGQFSGELLMVAGRRSIYRCQAAEPSELLQLSAKDLRTLIARTRSLATSS